MQAPPFSYGGILSTSADIKHAAIEDMRRDTTILHGLESIAHTVPGVSMWVDDCKELICVSVRALYAAFERDKFRCTSPDGRRHLATLLLVLPDTTIVENLHQHCRDLNRQCRRMMISKVARARACVDSGVLERHQIGHKKVTREQFISNFRVRDKKIAWRFNPRRHKLHARWSQILDKRSWASTTPESFRACLAAWHWGQVWWQMPADQRPAFMDAIFSAIAPASQIIVETDSRDGPVLCMGSAKWGALTLSLNRVEDDGGRNCLLFNPWVCV